MFFMANSHQPYREDSYLKLKIGTTTIKGIFLLSEPVSVVPISLSLSLSLSFKPFNRKEQLSFVIILSVLSLTLYFHILTESIFYQVNFTSQDALNQHSLVLSNYLLFLKKWPFSFISGLSIKQYNFYDKSMWKNVMSAQYTALGFEPMTSKTWVVCHDH